MGRGEFMPTEDMAIAVRKVTARQCERISRVAFDWARKRRNLSAGAVRQAEGDLDRALTWLGSEDATVTRLAAVVDTDTTQHGIDEERARRRRYNTWVEWGTTDMYDPNPHTGKDDPRLQPAQPAWAQEPFTVDHDPPHRSHGRDYGISR